MSKSATFEISEEEIAAYEAELEREEEAFRAHLGEEGYAAYLRYEEEREAEHERELAAGGPACARCGKYGVKVSAVATIGGFPGAAFTEMSAVHECGACGFKEMG